MMGNDYFEIGKKKYSIGLRIEISIMTPERQLNAIWFPLWTVSDCLEFLKSRSFYGSISDVGSYYETYYKKIIVGENNEDLSKKVYSGIVKTPLEACLKAALSVLEEKG